MSTYIERLQHDLINAQERYYNEQSTTAYNEVRRVTKALAHVLLVQKACQGSTNAIIELEKSYKNNYKINNLKDLEKLEDLDVDQLQVIKQLQKILPQNKDLEIKIDKIIKKYEEGEIGLNELNSLLSAAEKAQKTNSLQKITDKLTVNIVENVASALLKDYEPDINT